LYEYGSSSQRIKNFCFFTTSRSYNVYYLKRNRFSHLIRANTQCKRLTMSDPRRTYILKELCVQQSHMIFRQLHVKPVRYEAFAGRFIYSLDDSGTSGTVTHVRIIAGVPSR
jgi:hypothetical protein